MWGRSGPCNSGFYCPAGSTNATSVPCPPGRVGTGTGWTNATCASLCPLGSYCAGGAAATVACSTAGFWCPAGSFSPTGVHAGAAAYAPGLERTFLSLGGRPYNLNDTLVWSVFVGCVAYVRLCYPLPDLHILIGCMRAPQRRLARVATTARPRERLSTRPAFAPARARRRLGDIAPHRPRVRPARSAPRATAVRTWARPCRALLRACGAPLGR